MGTVEVRNGQYRGRWMEDTITGRVRRAAVLGSAKDMTRSQARRKLVGIIQQAGVNTMTALPDSALFASKVKEFELTYVAKRKPSFQATLRSHLKRLVKTFGHMPADSITADAVNQWVGSDDVRGLSVISVKGLVSTLQTALRRRFGEGEISYPSIVEPEDDEKRFTPEEVRHIVSKATGMYRVLFVLAAETGMRAGELYALRPHDILWSHKQIRVTKAAWNGKLQSPKTKNAVRFVPVKDSMLTMLRSHLLGRTEGFVFESKRGTVLQNTTVLGRHLHPILREAGIPMRGMHGFRHHRVSVLVEQGVNVALIRKWVGHGSQQMIDHYTHLSPDYGQDEMRRLPSVADSFTKTLETDPFDPKIEEQKPCATLVQ